MAQGPSGSSDNGNNGRTASPNPGSTSVFLQDDAYDARSMLRPAGFRPSRSTARQGIGFSGTNSSRRLSSRNSSRISKGGRV